MEYPRPARGSFGIGTTHFALFLCGFKLTLASKLQTAPSAHHTSWYWLRSRRLAQTTMRLPSIWLFFFLTVYRMNRPGARALNFVPPPFVRGGLPDYLRLYPKHPVLPACVLLLGACPPGRFR